MDPCARAQDRAAAYTSLELALSPARLLLQPVLNRAVGLPAKGENGAQIGNFLRDGNEEGVAVRLEVPVPDAVLFYLARAGKLKGRSPFDFENEFGF